MKSGMKTMTAALVAAALMIAPGCSDKNKGGKADGKNADKGKQEQKCPEGMALAPAGEFQLGCAGAPGKCPGDEIPAKKISLKAFCIDVKEVTQKEYTDAVGMNPSGNKNCGEKCPVEQLTWEDARAFCEKKGKRLPGEAEWEKAARAGSSGRYFWGEAFDGEYAWFQENSAGSSHEAGSKKPNNLGIYDMLGNVSEWTMDCYDPSWFAKMKPTEPLNTVSGCDFHVARGGSYFNPAASIQITERSGFNVVAPFIGFRCASDPE